MNKLLLPLVVILSISNAAFAAGANKKTKVSPGETPAPLGAPRTPPRGVPRTPPRVATHLSPHATPSKTLAKKLKNLLRWKKNSHEAPTPHVGDAEALAAPVEAFAADAEAFAAESTVVSPVADFEATASHSPRRPVAKGSHARTPDRHPFGAPSPPGSAKKASPRATATRGATDHCLAGAGVGLSSHAASGHLPLPPRVARGSLKRKPDGGASAGAMDHDDDDEATHTTTASTCVECGLKISSKDFPNTNIFRMPDGSIKMVHPSCRATEAKLGNATGLVTATAKAKALMARPSRAGTKGNDSDSITAQIMLGAVPPDDILDCMTEAINGKTFSAIGKDLMGILEGVRRPNVDKLKELVALAVIKNSKSFFKYASQNKHFKTLIVEKYILGQAVAANADKVYNAFLPIDNGKLNRTDLYRHLLAAIEDESIGIIDVISKRCPELLATSNEQDNCLSTAINSNKLKVVEHLVKALHVDVQPHHRRLAAPRGKAMQDALGSAH